MSDHLDASRHYPFPTKYFHCRDTVSSPTSDPFKGSAPARRPASLDVLRLQHPVDLVFEDHSHTVKRRFLAHQKIMSTLA